MKTHKLTTLAMAVVACFALWACDQPQPPQQAQNNPHKPAPVQPRPAPPDVMSDQDVRLDKNVVLVIDGSGSMQGDAIEQAKSSVKAVSGQLQEWNVCIVAFDRTGTGIRMPLSKASANTIGQVVDQIKTGGGTPLGTAMKQGLQTLQARESTQQGYGTYMLMVITDGAADSGHEERLMRNIAEQTVGSGYALDVIGYRINGKHVLKDYAHNYREAGNAADLSKALSQALAEASPTDFGGSFQTINYPGDYSAPQKP